MLIVPFIFQRPYHEAIMAAKQEGWRLIQFENERLFCHINDLLSVQQSVGTIGQRFSLESEKRNFYGMPQNFNTKLHLEKGQSGRFEIKDVDLYLFETQTGFIVMDIAYGPSVQVEEIISMNYLLGKVGSHGPSISYDVHSTSGVQTITSTLGVITSKLAKPFQAEFVADNSQGTTFHAHFFSSVLIDSKIREHPDWQVNIRKWLFLIRKGYKNSYKPTSAELEDSLDIEVMQLFENSFWGVALEGVANLTILTGDESTDKFFSSNYFGNVKHTYLYLYIIALHQRYTLQFLNRKVARIQPPMIKTTLRSVREYNREELFSLQEQIAIFNLRCRFNQVSNNSIHEKLYKRIVNVLYLVELQEELQHDLNSISLLINVQIQDEQQRKDLAEKENDKQEQRKEAEKEVREKRFHFVVLILTTIFVVITSSTDLWDIFMNIDEERLPDHPKLRLLLWGLLGVLWASVVVLCISYIKMKNLHSLFSENHENR